jgi:hypothetical protein
MTWIPYGVVVLFFSAAAPLILWQVRLYGESIHDNNYSLWIAIGVVCPCILFLLIRVMNSRTFDQCVNYFSTEKQKLEATKESKISVHPIVQIFIVWMIFGLPTVFVIDHLPLGSDLKFDLIILAYFVAPAMAFLATYSKPYKDAVVAYQAEKQSSKVKQEADRAKALHEAQEHARDAELQARIDALPKTAPPRPSQPPNLGPDAQRLRDEIDQLYEK